MSSLMRKLFLEYSRVRKLKNICVVPYPSRSNKSHGLNYICVAPYSSRSHNSNRLDPFGNKEINEAVDFCAGRVGARISKAVTARDLWDALPLGGFLLWKFLQAPTIKSGCEDHLLQKKVDKLCMSELEVIEFLLFGERSLLVRIFLKHGFSHDIGAPRRARKLHCMAYKTGMLHDEWNMSRILGLYSHECLPLEDIESIFQHAESKGILLYNQMISIYSKHDPEAAKRSFYQMIHSGINPNAETFMALLEAWSLACNPDEAIKVFKSMKTYGVLPQPVHYGAVVDSLARMKEPFYLESAVSVVKACTSAQYGYVFNAILNRCVPTQTAESDEEVKMLKRTIKIAQDFVNYLDQKGFQYGVLTKTHWRLRDNGLKWPKSVTTI